MFTFDFAQEEAENPKRVSRALIPITMKKILILATLIILFKPGFSQYNHTYDINGSAQLLTPGFVISTSDRGTVAISNGYAGSSEYLILTKHDFYGNTVFNNRIDPAIINTDGLYNAKALHETYDRGILIAGYWHTVSNPLIVQPFLMKVDGSGNLLWCKIYPVNTNLITSIGRNKISIHRVMDAPSNPESYLIVANSASDVRAGDVAVNVLRVTNNGTLIWSNKYYDTAGLSNFLSIWDIPGDIAYSPVDNVYMITGWRTQNDGLMHERMFFFTINSNGILQSPFTVIQLPCNPSNEDMIYDINNNVFAVSYIHSASLGHSVSSGIGLITIDAAMITYLARVYWNDHHLENYGNSISLADQGDYVIGSNAIVGPQQFSISNPTLLKVDNSGSPIFYQRYNILDNVINFFHCNSTNGNTFGQEYTLINNQTNVNDLRVIRTDINGRVCGS
jgi:hypothetical protein